MEYIKVLKKISENSNSAIFKGKHLLTNRFVTLKQIKSESLKQGFPATTIREISVLKELKHTNIISLQNVFVNREQVHLLFDYVAMDLKTYLDRLPTDFQLTRGMVQSFTYQIASAISFCHQRRIFHRNLCPQNVLVNRKGTIKITDFATVQSYGTPQKVYTQSVTMLWYRAPEVLLGSSRYSPAIDVWAIGCIFGEMFSRKPMFHGDSEINQLQKIVEIIGFQDVAAWKGMNKLPHYFSELAMARENRLKNNIKGIKNIEIHLLKKMLKINPFQRILAKNILKHPYFSTFNPKIRIPMIFD